VVLGYAQPPEDVDLEWCRGRGIPVLRRLSGGTGVVHRGDLGISLALPASHEWGRAVVGLYERFLDVLEPALNDLGSPIRRPAAPAQSSRVRSPICFLDQLADTLAVDGRKAVGCSQVRRKGAVLVHAAVLLGLDPEVVARVFRVDEDRVRRGLAPALRGVSWREIAEAVVGRLAAALDRDVRHEGPPDPTPERLEPYRQAGRWAPVPEVGMSQS
jgi:lipoate-protein ligase A